MKRISKAKRAFLLAVVRNRICGACKEQPALRFTQTYLGCWLKMEREERARYSRWVWGDA